jgi:hypothetical protein
VSKGKEKSMKKQSLKSTTVRLAQRRMARELSQDEIQQVAGGRYTKVYGCGEMCDTEAY